MKAQYAGLPLLLALLAACGSKQQPIISSAGTGNAQANQASVSASSLGSASAVDTPPAGGPLPAPAAAATAANSAESRQDLRTVLFVDGNRGWVAGANLILATGDGGQNWAVQYLGPQVIYHLDAIDALHAWAVGEHQLLRTTDGGRNWQAAGEPGAPVEAVHFLSASVGYGVAVGPYTRHGMAALRGTQSRRQSQWAGSASSTRAPGGSLM